MEKFYVCRSENLIDGKITPFKVNGIDVVLISKDGKTQAFERFCPHQQVPLDVYGEMEGGLLTCMVHGFTFCAESGQQRKAPRCSKLKVYQLVINDTGEVLIKIPEKNYTTT